MGCRAPLPVPVAWGLRILINTMPAVTRVRLIKTFIQEKTQDSVSSKCVEFKRTVKTSVIEVENMQLDSRPAGLQQGEMQKCFQGRGSRPPAPNTEPPQEIILNIRFLGKGQAEHLDDRENFGQCRGLVPQSCPQQHGRERKANGLLVVQHQQRGTGDKAGPHFQWDFSGSPSLSFRSVGGAFSPA